MLGTEEFLRDCCAPNRKGRVTFDKMYAEGLGPGTGRGRRASRAGGFTSLCAEDEEAT